MFPQAAQDSEWTGANLDMALAELDAATREFRGDPDRTYLTGLSMGGYGTWQLALQTRDRFAALVPICGGSEHPARTPDDARRRRRRRRRSVPRCRHAAAQ